MWIKNQKRKKQARILLGLFLLLLLLCLGLVSRVCVTKGQADELFMFPSTEGAQNLCVLVKTSQGKLIVIDGGWESDAQMLEDKIKEYGGTVDAWLLTHPHGDHVGALLNLLQEGNAQIQIRKIYYSFASPEWYQTYAPDDPGMAGELLECFKKLPDEMLDDGIGQGSIIQVDDIKIEVMNDRSGFTVNAVNNSCIVYKFWMRGQTVLFLGDLGYEAGEKLLQDRGSKGLKADIVQMAHHGQSAVGKEVYEAISPKICLWPTPQWLWDNDNGGGVGSGPWYTLETRAWMEELHVQENLCTKDGDIHMYFQ